MFRFIAQAAVLVTAGLALGGCPMEQPKTAAPVKKPPAADYQQPVGQVAKPANLSAICYNSADLAIVRARMMQQEMSVATLQCQNAGGGRVVRHAGIDCDAFGCAAPQDRRHPRFWSRNRHL